MVNSLIYYLLIQFLLYFTPNPGVVKSAPKLMVDSLAQHIYLSFDDGPLPGTSNCIDICVKENVPATFFEVGLHQSRSAYGQKLYNRVLANKNLFALCNHSYSHALGKYLDFYHQPDSALVDFIKAKGILKPDNNIARLPGNNAWNTQDAKRASGLVRPLVHKLDSAGFNIIGWDLQWQFNRYGKPVQSPEVIALLVDSLFANQQTKTKNHLVILMHDHMFRTAEDSLKLEKMIALLKMRPHYRFDKLTSYPGLKRGGY